MNPMARIDRELEMIGRLQRKLKGQAMYYQYDLKMEVCKALGLTFKQVDLPYVQWAEIRDKYLNGKWGAI
jgi:hypothetical protein